jgi:hypothetical protein
MDGQALNEFANEILSRIEGTDYKSYDFAKDPDMNFKFI